MLLFILTGYYKACTTELLMLSLRLAVRCNMTGSKSTFCAWKGNCKHDVC